MHEFQYSRRSPEPLAYMAAVVLMVLTMREANMLYLAGSFLCIGASVRRNEPGRRIYLGASLLLAALSIAYFLGHERGMQAVVEMEGMARSVAQQE